MDYSLPGSSVHGVPPCKNTGVVAMSSSRGSFLPDLTQGSNLCLLHCRQIIYLLSHQGSPGRHYAKLNTQEQGDSGSDIKNLPVVQRWVRPLGQEDTLEKEIATHSNILVWRIPQTEEPGRS